MTGVVPREIVERVDKQGFSTDEESWLRGALGAEVEQVFRESETEQRPYFRRGSLLAALESHRAGTGSPAELWRAFCVERWLRLFIDPPRLTAPRPGEGAPTTSVRAADRVVRLGVSDALPA